MPTPLENLAEWSASGIESNIAAPSARARILRRTGPLAGPRRLGFCAALLQCMAPRSPLSSCFSHGSRPSFSDTFLHGSLQSVRTSTSIAVLFQPTIYRRSLRSHQFVKRNHDDMLKEVFTTRGEYCDSYPSSHCHFVARPVAAHAPKTEIGCAAWGCAGDGGSQIRPTGALEARGSNGSPRGAGSAFACNARPPFPARPRQRRVLAVEEEALRFGERVQAEAREMQGVEEPAPAALRRQLPT